MRKQLYIRLIEDYTSSNHLWCEVDTPKEDGGVETYGF